MSEVPSYPIFIKTAIKQKTNTSTVFAAAAVPGPGREAGVAAQHGEEGDVVRTVLAEFYNATGGPRWYHRCAPQQNNNNGSGCWLDPASPDYCQWLGITCRPAP